MPTIIVTRGERIEHINVTDTTYNDVVDAVTNRTRELRGTKYSTEAETRSDNLGKVEQTLRKVLTENS